MHGTSRIENAYDRTGPETPTCEVLTNGVIEISLLSVCTGDTSI